jgi:hypothetical protein
VIRSSAARWLFELTVVGAVECHQVETDTGVVQIDSLHLDDGETVRRARAFMDTFDRRVEQEAAFLREVGASVVVADIPPLGIAAAARAGCSAAAMSNFTWDWIYSAYDGAGDVIRELSDAYALADVALRLPMHGGFASIANVIDLPFVARRSTREPAETRRALGVPEDGPIVLVSFGGYGLDGLDWEVLSRLHGYCVLVGGNVPLTGRPSGLCEGRRGTLFQFDERAAYAAGVRYEDVVRAVDVVVTKPGYGIISECAANGTALLYTSRGHFIEYDVLVREMPRFVRSRFIDHPDLFSGRWAPALDALLCEPAPARPAVDGTDIAVEHLLALVR